MKGNRLAKKPLEALPRGLASTNVIGGSWEAPELVITSQSPKMVGHNQTEKV